MSVFCVSLLTTKFVSYISGGSKAALRKLSQNKELCSTKTYNGGQGGTRSHRIELATTLGGVWPGNRVSARPGCRHGDFQPEIPCPLKLDNLLYIQIVSEYYLLSQHKWTRT